MSKRRTVKDTAKQALAEDTQARQKVMDETAQQGIPLLKVPSRDSFTNFAMKLGVGTDNASSFSGYGFNPITRIRQILEWIHRGSWLGGVAIDLVADDMTRAGCKILGELSPKSIEKIEESMVTLAIWNCLNRGIKWGRLYGGAISVMMIEGQKWETPLRLDTVGPNQFKGLLVLDRWMVEPSLNDLVQDMGPFLGMPKFYRVTASSPALPRIKIHYTRCIRHEGIELPYWQSLQENLWTLSFIERLYDRMVAFDSATQGAAQLVYKAFIRTFKIKGYREVIAAGGDPVDGLVESIRFMTRFQGIEGVTLMDSEDEYEGHEHHAFTGLAEALVQFGQQLSGALQIPLVRLFGQSPAGLNSTGESDLRTYYDGIAQQQEKCLKVPLTNVYRAIAQSQKIKLPDGFGIKFKPLWQLTPSERPQVSKTVTDTVVQAVEAGLVSVKTGMKELRQSSEETGVFTNITDDEIDASEEELAPSANEVMENQNQNEEKESEEENSGSIVPFKKKSQDSVAAVTAMKKNHNLDIVIENPKDTLRSANYNSTLAGDYGYLRGTMGNDGDQMDCFIGPNYDSRRVFVIHQNDENGEFDEHKCMLGYNTLDQAMSDYFQSYDDGRSWDRVGRVEVFDMDKFKSWLGGFRKGAA